MFTSRAKAPGGVTGVLASDWSFWAGHSHLHLHPKSLSLSNSRLEYPTASLTSLR